jgi:hypothetical protein
MAASQVVLYFENQEDAVLFALAASSVISTAEPGQRNETLVRIAQEISKVSRITTEGVLKPPINSANKPRVAREHCA